MIGFIDGGYNSAPELPRNVMVRRRLFDLAEEEVCVHSLSIGGPWLKAERVAF